MSQLEKNKREEEGIRVKRKIEMDMNRQKAGAGGCLHQKNKNRN